MLAIMKIQISKTDNENNTKGFKASKEHTAWLFLVFRFLLFTLSFDADSSMHWSAVEPSFLHAEFSTGERSPFDTPCLCSPLKHSEEVKNSREHKMKAWLLVCVYSNTGYISTYQKGSYQKKRHYSPCNGLVLQQLWIRIVNFSILREATD